MVRYNVPRMPRLLLLACSALWLALTGLAPPAPTPTAGAPFAQANTSFAGQFLVATADLRDPRFTRSVVYMLRHDAATTIGLIVNRPVQEMPLLPLLRRFGLDERGVSGNIRFHYGGPVEPGLAFLLHTAEYATEGTERVAGDIAVTPLTARPIALEDIAHGKGPLRYLLTLGYAGWAPGQLENEIDAGAWITVPADATILFDDDYATKWERAMARRRLTI